MVDTEGEFIPPPEAPVFEPTWEEFQDPLGYISKIRPIAEKTGICKVRPPPDWQPPFAVDVDTFKFIPRVQRLNELEAKTRIKLNFLDRLAKFWELQGTPLRIPLVERKYLDLYLLQKIVNEEGGFEIICRERKWSKVASRMTYGGGKGVGSTLRTHYEKVLYPYDLFQAGVTLGADKLKLESKDNSPIKEEQKDQKYEPGNEISPEGSVKGEEESHSRRSKRIAKENIDYTSNSELRKLQFFGPGPKNVIPDHLMSEELEEEEEEDKILAAKRKMKTRDKKNVSYVDLYMCHTCNRGDREDCMLLCDGCDDAFHTFCLIPPVSDIPQGDWRCPKCVAKECAKPKTAYGFAQAHKEYSLQSYGEMADQFKLDYFNMPVHLVPCSTVEREFWRLVNCIEEDVVVEYGADIHAMEFGSGFPVVGNKEILAEDEEYCSAGWNLNNLPVLEQSVLKYIGGDISGMKVPWCYVGMCFSSFCWHTEDHWSYSINYLHWGEPKTWYGVPGAKAELLEECMKKNAPELFEQSPDLLHQLTTIMNPNVLMAYGVPIVRTNQCAGEFIITFPRAYHAGFNQGYNFAEAVNFCPADWIANGRACVNHYRNLKRQCVFSHEELICKMATYPERMDLNLAAAVHQDMLFMVDEEKRLRKKLLDKGTTEAEREAFELLPDDERQCAVCKTTCFLSAVTCNCSATRLVCIQHADSLCECEASKLCLRYRYTLDELPAMLYRLKVRAESFDNWAYKVKMALEAEDGDKADLLEFCELLNESRDKKFPDSPLLQALADAVAEAEKCSNVASQLLGNKVRTRNRQSGDSKYVAKLSLEELQCFSEQILALPCCIKEAGPIQSLVDQVEKFQREALDALEEATPNTVQLQTLMDTAVTLDVDLPEIPRLKQLVQQSQWLDEVNLTLADPNQVTLEAMRKLLETGVALAPHHACEKAMAELQELLTVSERWEEKARVCLQARPRHSLATLESILSETSNIPALLPNVSQLTEAVNKAREWVDRVKAIQNGDHYPYISALESVVNKGRPISVRLDQLPQLESQVATAKSWRERTARTFLKKNSTYSLVEILSPRTNIGLQLSGKLRRRKLVKEAIAEREARGDAHVIGDIKVEDNRDPASIVAAFKIAEQQELDAMQDLRNKNADHYQQEGLGGKYCLCRRSPTGLMLQCELCKDWFHSSCVPLPKSANLKAKTSPASLIQAARDLKFLCPFCLRSRRPRLETILSLLVSLQKLPVRLPEGEALQCLTERAMAWQDKARQALATEELSSALEKLSVLSQKMVEQAAREKTEKIISAELMKAASNPDLHDHLQAVTPAAFGSQDGEEGQRWDGVVNPSYTQGTDSTSMYGHNIEHTPQSMYPTVGSNLDTDDIILDDIDIQQGVGMSSEHAYSSVPKVGENIVAPSPKKQQRKSPLLPRQLDTSSVLKMSAPIQRQLETLMMEGDLLEVSLDETQHIWRILQSCSPNANSRILHIQGAEAEAMKLKAEKKKKRKKDQTEGGQPTDELKVKKKKKKIILPDGTEKYVKDLGDKKGPKDPEKKKRKRIKKKTLLNLDEVGDDDCSALKCIKPSGEEVNWVQCDGCQLWFHLLCVGLGEDEVSENEDYNCFTCRNKKSGHVEELIGGVLSAEALSTLSRLPIPVPTLVQGKGALKQSLNKPGKSSVPRPQKSSVAPLPKPVESRADVVAIARQRALESSTDEDIVMVDNRPGSGEALVEIEDSDDELAIDSSTQEEATGMTSIDEDSNHAASMVTGNGNHAVSMVTEDGNHAVSMVTGDTSNVVPMVTGVSMNAVSVTARDGNNAVSLTPRDNKDAVSIVTEISSEVTSIEAGRSSQITSMAVTHSEPEVISLDADDRSILQQAYGHKEQSQPVDLSAVVDLSSSAEVGDDMESMATAYMSSPAAERSRPDISAGLSSFTGQPRDDVLKVTPRSYPPATQVVPSVVQTPAFEQLGQGDLIGSQLGPTVTQLDTAVTHSTPAATPLTEPEIVDLS